jgi:hypothetical protein
MPARLPRRQWWAAAACALAVLAVPGSLPAARGSAAAPAAAASPGAGAPTVRAARVPPIAPAAPEVWALPPEPAAARAGAGAAGAAPVPPAGEPARGEPARGAGRFRVLQMNLCDSGLARCYPTLNNGRSPAEAAALIRSTRPDLVTANEICRADAMGVLLAAVRQDWPGDWVFAAFMPVYDRRTRGPYRCADGDRYGIGVLGRVPAARWRGVLGFGGSYPDPRAAGAAGTQDPRSEEVRGWLCVDVAGSYYGCTTHLANTSRQVAARQCGYLTGTVLPALAAREDRTLPAVVGGDLNLRYRGSPDVQDCVRPGWFRKGDGQVQHVLASTGYTFDFVLRIPMRHTDHPALLVGLVAARITVPVARTGTTASR